MSNKLRVLMYHKVQHNRRDFLTVDVLQLREQLNFVKQNYNVIRLSELIAHIREGAALPENALLITFDDGYRNNFDLAYPVFKELGMPFTIFLVSDFIGKKHLFDGDLQEFLTTEQLLGMQDLAEFGLHSTAHQDIMNLPENLWHSEIRKCIQTIEKQEVMTQKAWAYTYGNFPRDNEAMIEKLNKALTENGVVCAFRIGNRINKIPLTNPYLLQRIDIRGNQSFFKFKFKVRFGKLF
jgi:peptidoglycan/xylan/chitin deacetylase (PgdA/CDA1 family)